MSKRYREDQRGTWERGGRDDGRRSPPRWMRRGDEDYEQRRDRYSRERQVSPPRRRPEWPPDEQAQHRERRAPSPPPSASTHQTQILFFNNVPSDATEEEIANKVGSVIDIRCVRSVQVPVDKSTGRRKGFAFVDCGTVSNATLVKDALNGAALRSDWSHGGLSIEFSNSARSNRQAAASAAAQVAILQATAVSSMTKSSACESDYVFDKATGYYRHRTTGALYDAVTGLFYDAATNVWYSWNEKTQEHIVVGGSSAPSASTNENTNRLVVATVEAAPTRAMQMEKYRDRAKERRKLHGEAILDGAAPRNTVKGVVTGGKIRTKR